ncbi:hypothetical protein EYR40_002251 [Pleurotus pulmonarius]|nr:hypothetical protein EYR36_002258 [Pleurotus pulmonarius]KAF4583760.1 hypothetical protein EYR40_002251 [Pleurotus pulmonarius]
MDISLVRQYCPKFRVLIIGKANAGKTTILQKVCNTTENPTAVDTTGRRMSLSLLKPSAGRGQHDIEQGYVFSGRDNFVFHDSRGFEAGTTAELERAKAFIKKRSSYTHIKNRLHAVWYCIPSDTPRLLLEDETSFFKECQDGKVPVVAIFTKFDYRHKEAMAQLIEGGMERPAARLAAPSRAKEDFEAKYITRLYKRSYPPQRHVYVYDMHLPMSNCDQLILATVDSLNDLSLKHLFVSTQKNRIHLYVGYAIEHVLKNQQKRRNGLRRHEMKNIVLNCINWFPVNQEVSGSAVAVYS